jgi:hypothetical protein
MELDQTLHQLYLVTNYVVTVRVVRVVKFQEGTQMELITKYVY